MARPLRPADLDAVRAVDSAIVHLRSARDLLARAGADKAAARVRLALASADGARRHVDRRLFRAEQSATPTPNPCPHCGGSHVVTRPCNPDGSRPVPGMESVNAR